MVCRADKIEFLGLKPKSHGIYWRADAIISFLWNILPNWTTNMTEFSTKNELVHYPQIVWICIDPCHLFRIWIHHPKKSSKDACGSAVHPTAVSIGSSG